MFIQGPERKHSLGINVAVGHRVTPLRCNITVINTLSFSYNTLMQFLFSPTSFPCLMLSAVVSETEKIIAVCKIYGSTSICFIV